MSEVTFGPSGLPGRRLAWGGATVDVVLFGAHITSWKTPGADGMPMERLWMSSCSPMDGSAPIRGGIPIAWPQFANDGPLPLHGFAREQLWAVAEANNAEASTSLTLQLADSLSTRDGGWRTPPTAPFPWKFTLRFTVTLGAGFLQLRLEVVNQGSAGACEVDAKMVFTTCFHTYFRSADSAQVTLSKGLKGVRFIDKVDGLKMKTHGGEDTPHHVGEKADTLQIEQASAESKGFVDRIYCHPAVAGGISQVLNVGQGLDPAAANAFSSWYELHQSDGFRNTVIFNPWKEGKRGPAHPDFDDDGYKYMICVEPAVAKPSSPIELAAGEKWTGECWMGIGS